MALYTNSKKDSIKLKNIKQDPYLPQNPNEDSNPMRILHLIGSMDPASGGPCQGIRNANAELEKLGIHREVVCLDAPDSAYLSEDSFPIHAIGVGKGPARYNPKLKPWLEANLDRFDVVIINGLWLSISFIAWRCINRFRKLQIKKGITRTLKFFVMPHGMLDPYFQKAPERKLKAIRNWLYWKLFENQVVNNADAVLFTCETELLLAREPFSPYHPKKEENIGLGIIAPPEKTTNMSEAFQAACPDLNNKPYLLFISRIHEKKGVDILIKAYSLLVETNTKLPKLVIAGPGMQTPYGQKIQKMVDTDATLKNLVYFPGMLTGDAKWGAFYGTDAFVLASHQENFGIAVAEALACSKPVLISNQVNIWREIEAGGGGIVANDTVKGAMKMLSKWVHLSKDQKMQMNDRAFLVYKEHFEVQHAAKVFVETVGGIAGFNKIKSL